MARLGLKSIFGGALQSILWILLMALGHWIYGPPTLPDSPFSQWNVFGAFLIFAAFCLATFSWGSFLSSAFRIEGAASIWIFGVFFLFVSSFLFAILGCVGPFIKWLWIAVLYLGVWIARPRFEVSRSDRDWMILLVSVGCLYMLQGFKVPTHGDPFIYDLMGPRFWYDSGKVWIPETRPYLAQAGSWNMLYLWAHELVGGGPGEGLVAAQHFAQWTHTFFGFIGTGVVIAAFLRQHFARVSMTWIALAVIAALSTPDLRAMASLAKNDWGAIFWTFAGAVFLFKQDGRRNLFFAGIFFGLAFSAKYISAFTIFGFLCADLILSKKFRWQTAIGFVLGASPILIRNFTWTGSPIFPVYDQGFFGPTLSSLHVVHQQSGFSWERLPNILLACLRQNVLNFLIVLTPFVASKKSSRALALLGVVALISIIFFTIKLGATGMLRWIGPGLLVLTLCGVMTLAIWAGSRRTVLGIAAIAILAQANLPLFNLAQIGTSKFATGREAIVGHTNGQAKAWIREHLPVKSRLLLFGDNETYYLSHYPLSAIEEHAPLDRVIQQSQDPVIFWRAIREYDFDYLVEYRPKSKIFRGWIDEFASKEVSRVVYDSGDARVISLKP